MMRTVGTAAILLGLLAWLVLSYWPAALAALPLVAFSGAWATTTLPFLAAVALVVSVAIQGWLVYATVAALRRPAGPAEAAALSQFRLNVGMEAVWTAAPLLITVVLAAWLLLGGR
jgi:heme/copper-type cytochrome/quinol oxidase subunit 2